MKWPRPAGTGAQFSHLPITERSAMTPLLAHRIEEYGLVFPSTRPVFDRIFVFPLESDSDNEKFEGSSLYKSEKSKARLGASRGVLIKAGMGALEQLWSHGIELGHIVLTARLSPWERSYAARGRIYSVLVLRASEVVGSEDLEMDVAEGCVNYRWGEDGRLELAERRIDPPTHDEGI